MRAAGGFKFAAFTLLRIRRGFFLSSSISLHLPGKKFKVRFVFLSTVRRQEGEAVHGYSQKQRTVSRGTRLSNAAAPRAGPQPGLRPVKLGLRAQQTGQLRPKVKGH